MIFFTIAPDKIACESVTAVPALSVACFPVILVFMAVILESIFALSYASTPVIVKLLSSVVSVKFEPTIFFNLDVVVLNKL